MLKKLTLVWAALDVLLLAAGALTIFFSMKWKQPNLLINMTISSNELTATFALGAMLVATAILAIPSILPAPTNNTLLKVLNGVIVIDIIATTAIGTVVWFFSLQQRAEFDYAWEKVLTNAQRTTFENMYQCCGYYNGTAAGGFYPPDTSIGAAFCSTPEIVANATACVGPITQATDSLLEVSFSTIYGWVAILILLGLATTSLINERTILVRFRKIDAKRGGSGFV